MPTFSSVPDAVDYIESQQQLAAKNLPTIAISKAAVLSIMEDYGDHAMLSVSIINESDGTQSLLIYDKNRLPSAPSPNPPVCRVTSTGQRVCCPPTCNQYSITVNNFESEEQA